MCYNYHESGQLAKDCLRLGSKRHEQLETLAEEVETPNLISIGKEMVHVSATVCEEWVVSEPTMLQVQGSID